MRAVIVALLAVLFAVAFAEKAPENAVFSALPLGEAEQKRLFYKFLSQHEKRYDNEETLLKRYQIFKTNVEKARVYNLMSNSTTYGVTKFSDLTEEEFSNIYLSKKLQSRDSVPKHIEQMNTYKPRSAIPDTWDWRVHGAVTPVKNQGQCGSCWAFSTTGNVEGQWFLKSKKLVSLSEQQLVDCDHECDEQQSCDSGCNGGLMSNAFQYIIKNKGIDSEASYPYEAIDDTCRFSSQNVAANLTSWKMLPSDETQLAAWLYENGPVAVAINAGWLQVYVGGVSDPLVCNPKHLDHGVLLVGFGMGKTWFGETVPYWLVKNSWGSGWGEKGFFRIIRGKGKCGINTFACTGLV